jgi:hypothetical protein
MAMTAVSSANVAVMESDEVGMSILDVLFDAWFSMRSVSYQGKYAISSSPKFLLIIAQLEFVLEMVNVKPFLVLRPSNVPALSSLDQ